MQIETLSLFTDKLDGPVLAAFAGYESSDLQFGIDWLSNMAATALEEGEEPVIYISRRSAEDFIACPMKVHSRTAHANSLSTFYSTTYSPIVSSSTPEPLFVALFEYWARNERFATLTLTPMDNDSPVFGMVQRALIQAGWRGVHDFFCFGNWIHERKQASYQDYLAERPSRLRNTVIRKTRQFLDADRGQLEIITGGELLEDAIERFVAIYNSSWKRSEPFPDFIPKLLRLSAKRGWLRLGIASYNNKPVAGQIWLVWAGTAYIFKLAYHQEHGQLSPGTVLTAYLMEHVIDTESVLRIDYLSGDDDYKRDWMSARRERHGIAAYNLRTVRGTGNYIARALNTLRKKLNNSANVAHSAVTRKEVAASRGRDRDPG